MKNGLFFIMSLCFILLCSCKNKRDESLLLQNHEYKLWYIINEEESKDSVEWINIGTLKIESFWEEYDWDNEGYETDYNFDYRSYYNFIKDVERPRRFKKKGHVPEYLYVDRDGYACILFFDREAGNFFEKQDAEMTGLWKLKNDSTLLINNNLYSFKQTDIKSDTLQISNMNTGKTLKIKDSGFPFVCGHAISWTNEDEKHYRKVLGLGIKDNPLLQGNDHKLWREDGELGFYYPNSPDLYEGYDYLFGPNYYCMFLYFDRYGRYANLAMAADEWRMWENQYHIMSETDLKITTYWRPVSKDSTFCAFWIVNIAYTHPDTLILSKEGVKDELRYIAINLPPKSKWQKFKKR
jgi:hypothetical protein